MQNKMQALVNEKHGRSIRGMHFFALFYQYFWLEVEQQVILHAVGKLLDFTVFFKGC